MAAEDLFRERESSSCVCKKVVGRDVCRFCYGCRSADCDMRILVESHNEFITGTGREKDYKEFFSYLLGPTNVVLEIRVVLGQPFGRLLSQLT